MQKLLMSQTTTPVSSSGRSQGHCTFSPVAAWLLDLEESTDGKEVELNAVWRLVLRLIATQAHPNDAELELSSSCL